ncbi:glycine/betaine ABC transporter substrate-binding protein [Salicibibacter halophilus]|uniref:Glycine/betaine ABC transporter substrate-binding protein n=1 Tax=Salicibibacter halophilus TaxID=2502791 RepID=A0A514LEY1_9BACI|nr:glycine betaine ABC transporter substrate-binding protein [Salicibibacter halophilus]QDI90414.1 glycine/betaine ABC transporter substrate-binding protein [Salicibibacter halophilus]
MKQRLLVGLSTMSLIMAGCGNGDENGEEFTSAAATSTDAKLNVQMVKSLVEDQTDHTVEIVEDLPASPQIFAGIERGEFDIASLYSGEVHNNYFDEVEYTTDPDETLEQAQTFFGEEYDIKWYDPIGFINNYSIGVQESFAEENNIETVTDLGEYADELTLGTDNAWIERDNDGYRGFQEAYGYEFADARGMDVSLMYDGIANGEVDVVTTYTVDPQIIENDLEVLEDDQEFFPPYESSLVATNEVVDSHPEINEILESMVDLISTEEMTDLMYEVEIEERDTKQVADEFLQEKGMLD